MKMNDLIESILLVLKKQEKFSPVEIQNALKEKVVIIQIQRAIKTLTDQGVLKMEMDGSNKIYSINQKAISKTTSVRIDKGGRDVSTYNFKGIEYNKGRLAHAIIVFYAKKHRPNYKKLCEVFPIDLVLPYGLIKPRKEAIEMSKDRARFFIKDIDIVDLPDGQVCVSNQFTKDRIERFIRIVKEKLGYEIG